MRHALLCLGLVVAVTGACKVKNPNFCEDSPDHLCEPPDAAPMKCDEAMDCTGADKVCKMPDGVCVECTATEADACTGTTPICNTATNSCQGCTKHADCASNACLPDGSCAIESDVLYVKSTGLGTTCTKAAPCADVTTALAAAPPKSIVRVEGTITEATITLSSRDLTVLGDPGTSTLSTPAGDVIAIDGTSKVKLYDVVITGASAAGVRGLDGHSGSLEIQRCRVTGNNIGINYTGTGSFTLSRSTVSLNIVGGGVVLTKKIMFDISNNFIFRNGNTSTVGVGGLVVVDAQAGSRIEFNTIVDNNNMDGLTRSGGLVCDIASLSVSNNLIARNDVSGGDKTRAQKNGGCNFTGSLIQADFTGLLFTSPDAGPPYDYHLKLGSAGIDGSTGGAAVMTDFDGQARPNGTARDMGADEFYAQ